MVKAESSGILTQSVLNMVGVVNEKAVSPHSLFGFCVKVRRLNERSSQFIVCSLLSIIFLCLGLFNSK